MIREYGSQATIQPGAIIEFRVTGSNALYLDLNNSCLHVLAKKTKAVGTNIDATTAAPINQSFTRCFSKLAWSWTVEMWTTSAYCTRTAHLWRICYTTARRPKRLDSWAKAKPRTQPCTWMSLQSVDTMLDWTLEPWILQKVPWSSSLVSLTRTLFTKIA